MCTYIKLTCIFLTKGGTSLLHYKIYSQQHKEWVVLVHGAGGSSSIWYRQIRAYRKQFNVLVVDLRGHGSSKFLHSPNRYTFELVSKDILDVLDYEGIDKAHFVGISLGTILIRQLAEEHPERMHSMILAGAVIRITPRLNILLSIANSFKRFVPYMLLYRFFAWILMPKKVHEQSRSLFIEEAKKVQQREFLRWLSLTSSVANRLLKFNERDTHIPTLYIMGEEDYMFLQSVKEIVRTHTKSDLIVLENSGHVCNVDQPQQFNERSLQFLHAVT